MAKDYHFYRSLADAAFSEDENKAKPALAEMFALMGANLQRSADLLEEMKDNAKTAGVAMQALADEAKKLNET